VAMMMMKKIFIIFKNKFYTPLQSMEFLIIPRSQLLTCFAHDMSCKSIYLKDKVSAKLHIVALKIKMTEICMRKNFKNKRLWTVSFSM
jgi:hypothetical protein